MARLFEDEAALDEHISRTTLRNLAAWIRDELDPLIAREGPNVVHADDLLLLHDFFDMLLTSEDITVNMLRATSIHNAIMYVRGKATRWPGRLVDQCDQVCAKWTGQFGSLHDIRPFLYGRGGRLEGICRPGDLTKAAYLKRWATIHPDKDLSASARRHGHLGFHPGDWWISPLFAFHDGILDLPGVEHGICHDDHGAYALLLDRPDDEITTTTPNEFSYRCTRQDRGKFQLTSADLHRRHPIRVLRSHHLSNPWAPKVGVRYEGLYRVTGWSVQAIPKRSAGDNSTDELMLAADAKENKKAFKLIFEIRFIREDESDMEDVMRHPLAAEMDDYMEYKRLRSMYREGKTTPMVAEGMMAPKIRAHTRGHFVAASETAKIPGISRFLSREMGSNETSPDESRRGSPMSLHPYHDVPRISPSFSARLEAAETPYTDRVGIPVPARPTLMDRQHSGATTGGSAESTLSGIRDVAPWVDAEVFAPVPSPAPSPPPPAKRSSGPSHPGSPRLWPKSPRIIPRSPQVAPMSPSKITQLPTSPQMRGQETPESSVLPAALLGHAARHPSSPNILPGPNEKKFWPHIPLPHLPRRFEGKSTLELPTASGGDADGGESDGAEARSTHTHRSFRSVARSITPFSRLLHAGNKDGPADAQIDGQTEGDGFTTSTNGQESGTPPMIDCGDQKRAVRTGVYTLKSPPDDDDDDINSEQASPQTSLAPAAFLPPLSHPPTPPQPTTSKSPIIIEQAALPPAPAPTPVSNPTTPTQQIPFPFPSPPLVIPSPSPSPSDSQDRYRGMGMKRRNAIFIPMPFEFPGCSLEDTSTHRVVVARPESEAAAPLFTREDWARYLEKLPREEGERSVSTGEKRRRDVGNLGDGKEGKNEGTDIGKEGEGGEDEMDPFTELLRQTEGFGKAVRAVKRWMLEGYGYMEHDFSSGARAGRCESGAGATSGISGESGAGGIGGAKEAGGAGGWGLSVPRSSRGFGHERGVSEVAFRDVIWPRREDEEEGECGGEGDDQGMADGKGEEIGNKKGKGKMVGAIESLVGGSGVQENSVAPDQE